MSSSVGRKVKAAAAYRGIQLSKVAELMGMSASNFTTRLRTGKFTFEELDAIARILGAEFTGNFTFPNGPEI